MVIHTLKILTAKGSRFLKFMMNFRRLGIIWLKYRSLLQSNLRPGVLLEENMVNWKLFKWCSFPLLLRFGAFLFHKHALMCIWESKYVYLFLRVAHQLLYDMPSGSSCKSMIMTEKALSIYSTSCTVSHRIINMPTTTTGW